MRLADRGDLRLVAPGQVGDVRHRVRQQVPGGGEAESEGCEGAEEDAAVAAYDAAG